MESPQSEERPYRRGAGRHVNDRSRVAPDGARRRFHRFALDPLAAVVYVAGMAARLTSKLRSAVMIAIGG